MMTTPTAHRIAKHTELFVQSIADDKDALEALAHEIREDRGDLPEDPR